MKKQNHFNRGLLPINKKTEIMRSPFYLIVNKKGAIRTTKTQPDLKWDEISIKMNLELPDSLFQRPILTADVKVSDKQVSPRVITPEIKNTIEEAIKVNSGIEVKLSIVSDSNPLNT